MRKLNQYDLYSINIYQAQYFHTTSSSSLKMWVKSESAEDLSSDRSPNKERGGIFSPFPPPPFQRAGLFQSIVS